VSELKTKLREAFEKGGSEYLERVILTILDANFKGYETRDKVVQYLQYEYDRYNRLPDKTFLYALALQARELRTKRKKMGQVDLELARQFNMHARQVQELRSKVGFVKYRQKRRTSKRKEEPVEAVKVTAGDKKVEEPEFKEDRVATVELGERKVILHIELTIPSEILDLLKGGK